MSVYITFVFLSTLIGHYYSHIDAQLDNWNVSSF